MRYSILAYIDSFDTRKMQKMYQSRHDTLNAVPLLFTRKFIPQMTSNGVFAKCMTSRQQLNNVIF